MKRRSKQIIKAIKEAFNLCDFYGIENAIKERKKVAKERKK